MPYLRLYLRLLLAFLSGVISTLLVYAFSALVLGLASVPEEPRPLTGDTIEVFVRSNGVHTDFVLPVRSTAMDWSQRLPYGDFGQVDSTYQYLAFGWGDKGFYLDTPTWGDLKFKTAFNALFFLSSTTMHVSYLRHRPAEDQTCRRLRLTPAQYRLLLTYVQESFRTDQAGGFQLLAGKSYGLRDNFYEARGVYSFLRTCNVWTGQGLQRMGVSAPVWSPFDQAIFYHLPLPEPATHP